MAKENPFDPDLVRELATLIADTDLTEIEVEKGDLRIRVARTVTATVMAAVTPSPPTNETPINSMPSKEMTTVAPANTTERPAVSIAMPVDSRMLCPP